VICMTKGRAGGGDEEERYDAGRLEHERSEEVRGLSESGKQERDFSI